MTTDKDFKRLVRARMQKTGESYTAARAHFVARTPSLAPARSPAIDYAALAGQSDATIKAKTGCGWERWVKSLDYAQAYTWPHREIARYVREKYQVPGWWAQSITVGYERIKGLRAVGQRRDGSFEANKSRTFPVPLVRLYRAWHDSRARARWLPEVQLTVRTATRGKYLRIIWPDLTFVAVGFASRGPGKSQVAVQHGNLPDRAAAARLKQYWAERLDALGEVLAPE
jgi:uncharacterized protein YndB with AHSA1/START domain